MAGAEHTERHVRMKEVLAGQPPRLLHSGAGNQELREEGEEELDTRAQWEILGK